MSEDGAKAPLSNKALEICTRLEEEEDDDDWLLIQNGDGQLLEWLDPVKGSVSFLRDSQAKLLACVI